MWGGKTGTAGVLIKRVTSQPLSKVVRLTDIEDAKERG